MVCKPIDANGKVEKEAHTYMHSYDYLLKKITLHVGPQ